MSAQRAVSSPGGGIGNRGALPIHEFGGPTFEKVLIPALPGERIWLAFDVSPGIEVRGAANNGVALVRTAVGATHRDMRMWAVDRDEDGAPIDGRRFAPARMRSDLETPHLRLVVTAGNFQWDLNLVLANTVLWQEITDIPAPPPSRPKDVYGGFRLP